MSDPVPYALTPPDCRCDECIATRLTTAMLAYRWPLVARLVRSGRPYVAGPFAVRWGSA